MNQINTEQGITLVNQQIQKTEKALRQLESALKDFGAHPEEENADISENCKDLLYEIEECCTELNQSIDLFAGLLGNPDNSLSFITHEKVSEAFSVISNYCHAYNEAVENQLYTPKVDVSIPESTYISEMYKYASRSLGDLHYVNFRRKKERQKR